MIKTEEKLFLGLEEEKEKSHMIHLEDQVEWNGIQRSHLLQNLHMWMVLKMKKKLSQQQQESER